MTQDFLNQIPDWDDFARFSSYLPAAVVFVSNAIAIHSLWLPKMNKGRRAALFGYMLISLGLTVGVWYQSASTALESRRHAADAEAEKSRTAVIEAKIDTIKSYLGSVPSTPSEDVLDKVISRIAKPGVISPPQMAKLAHQIDLIKGNFPKNVYIARNLIYEANGADYNLYMPLFEALSRNGLKPQIVFFSPSSLKDQGLIIVAKDSLNPPDYVTEMKAAFDAINMPSAKIGFVEGVPYENCLTIVIAPAPI